jgi:hypothetical protein
MEVDSIPTPESKLAPDAVNDIMQQLFGDDADLFDHFKAKPIIDEILGQWSDEEAETETRRRERYIDLDVDAMRRAGQIGPNETFIPERLIDSAILREQPNYLAFLNKSRRLAIFRCLSDPHQDTQKLEAEFTAGLTYEKWLPVFFKVVDGAQLHGWDAVEVVFDESKPLHVAFEHVSHDRLFYNKEVDDPHDSEYMIRAYKVTSINLKRFVGRFGFDAEQVAKVLNKESSTKKRNAVYTIYKVYFKVDGVVFVAWYEKDTASNWLKAPDKLRLGIREKKQVSPAIAQQTGGEIGLNSASGGQGDASLSPMAGVPSLTWEDKDIDTFPIFVLNYRESEDEKATAHIGRAFLDGPRQEAHTSIVTSFVNSTMNASNVFGSPEQGDEAEMSMRQLDTVLENGKLYSKKINFFHMDYPPVEILTALQQLDVREMQQSGQVDFAVMNRKDARKTKAELDKSSETADLVRSVPLSLFSEFLRGVFSFSWRIVQSAALQETIPFLLIPKVNMAIGMNGERIPMPAQGQYTNDIATISKLYDVRPAGDVDFIQRVEKIEQMKQDWPVVQLTPAATEFLQDLMRLEYPDVGEKYAQLIAQGDPKAVVAALAAMLKGALQPPEVAMLSPEEQQKLVQLEKTVQQMLGDPNITFIPGNEQQQQPQTQV